MKTAANGRPIDILLVEDNPGDVRLAREIFRESRVPSSLHIASDGEQAMAFLRRQGVHAHAVRPDLILLDLNLPRKDGREVLAEIKADEDLRRIPVVVLTTSRAERDVHKAYELSANCYILKPLDLDRYTEIVRSIEEFWLRIVHLPGN